MNSDHCIEATRYAALSLNRLPGWVKTGQNIHLNVSESTCEAELRISTALAWMPIESPREAEMKILTADGTMTLNRII